MKNQQLSLVFKVSALAAALLTASCAEHAISELEQAKLEGAAFADHLAMEYESFAKQDSREYNHPWDARHFAVKGLQAATGLNVLPEDPRNWDLPKEAIDPITSGRERLTFALDKSGRTVAPALAARTQVLYDCWVQETENGDKEANFCEKSFMDSLIALEKAVHEQSPSFMVLFDMSSSKLSKKAESTLEEVAKIAKNLPNHTVSIIGNTDAGGGRKSNLILSHNRAMMVRDALISMGVDAHRIEAVGGGELGGREVDSKTEELISKSAKRYNLIE